LTDTEPHPTIFGERKEPQAMKRKRDPESLTVFEQIRNGLKESLAHARGKKALKTTVVDESHTPRNDKPPPSARRAIDGCQGRGEQSEPAPG
jgi:hypothetical protein